MIVNKRIRQFLALLLIIFVCAFSCSCGDETVSKLETPQGEMSVSFVDVGQGDCIFVRLPNSETMLVDCGEYSERENVKDFLDNQNVSKIDYLVASHPHADHIGAMAYIIENFEVGQFFMPDCEADTKAFVTMLEALYEKNVKSNLVKAGDVIFENESFRCDVLSPVLETYDNTNDYSVVMRLSCGKKTFLLTGDAEEYALKRIDQSLKADVLKLGHHGSSTSTNQKLLKKISPKYGVISCGEGNSYGHPHKEVIKLLKDSDVKFYRTDKDGTVTFLCDGESVEVAG